MSEMSAHQCVRGCQTIEYGQVCTATPGIVHGPSVVPTMCSVNATCDDAVLHRQDRGEWHTCAGLNAADWYAERGLGRIEQPTLDFGGLT